MGVVEPGLAVACQGGAGIGPANASPAPPAGGDDWAGDSIVVGAVDTPSARAPGDDSWAGDSVAVGAAPSAPPPPPFPAPSLDKAGYPPPPQPAAPPPFAPQPPQPDPYYPPQGYGPGSYGGEPARQFYTQTWFFALVAAIIIIAAVGYTVWRNWGGSSGTVTTTTTTPVTGTNPPVTPQPPANTAPRPGGPVLTAPGAPPARLSVQEISGGRYGIGFRVDAASGPIDGIIIFSDELWNGEATVIASNGAGAQSIGTGRFQLSREENTPARYMEVQWRQDGVGAGATGIGIAGRPGQADVALQGAGLCVADAESGQVIGCGQVAM